MFAKECSIDLKEKSIIFQLCHEFIKTSRALRYSPVHLKSLPVFIKDVFSLDSEQVLARFDTIALETLYYIAGWMIHAAKKAAPRRSINTRHCLVFFVNSATINDSDSNGMRGLPTGKVDRLIRFGGLKYATYQYFQFVARMEIIYCNMLSEEYIVTLGPNIVDRIRVALMTEKDVTDWLVDFVPPDTSQQCFNDIVQFTLLMYSRMRGKDFAMKLFKKNSALTLPMRQIQAVLSDPKHRVKKEVKTEEEQLMNDEFARIAKDMEIADEYEE